MTEPGVVRSRRSFLRRLLRRPLAVVSIVFLAIFLFTAAFAPLVSPRDPYRGDLRARLQPPSATYLLGTDQLGRDMLSRVIWGSRIAIMVGLVTVGVGIGGGLILGVISGYYGGTLVDSIIMRFIDVLMAFPYLLLVIVMVSVFGNNLQNAMIAIGIRSIPDFARVVRSVVLALREQEFVLAGGALGASVGRIMFVHIVPNCTAPVIVIATISVAKAILAEASLSFLGLGVQPPQPAWGSMVAIGREYLMTHPHLSIIPGVATMLLVFSLNMFGDALRDAQDPRGM